MAPMITIVHTPGCPHAALLSERLATAVSRVGGRPARVTVEEIADPDDAVRRGFHGSPALLVDGVDAFAGPADPIGFACRTYGTETGVEGAPSVEQLVAVLTARGGR